MVEGGENDLAKSNDLAEERSEHIDPSAAFGNVQNDESYEGIETETGEINWDCPCLGKITQPPCGDTFKEAFSCFFYSKSEPKGSECLDFFKKLRECFDKYPEIYPTDSDEDENSSSVKENQEATDPPK